MKKNLLIFFCLTVFSFAQEETLLPGNIQHGGFGGPVVKFTTIKKEFGVLVGGYGGWLINHTFMIGGGGYGLANIIQPDASVIKNTSPWNKYIYPDEGRIQFGYGGVILEYISNQSKLLHYNFNLLIGAGGVQYSRKDRNDYDEDSYADELFVLEPSIGAELNIASFFKLNLLAGYRYVNGVSIAGLSNSDLSGPSINLSFKFGKF
jgi:hypothetical protein